MKEWQKGIEIDRLLEVESFYTKYNEYALSPFMEVKKNRIAIAIDSKEYRVYEIGGAPVVMLNKKITKVKTPITMYKDVLIGYKIPGDTTITSFEWDRNFKSKALDVLSSCYIGPTWLYVWAEDKETCNLAEIAGYKWVGSKVTSMAEIIAVFFHDGQRYESLFPIDPRIHPDRTLIEDFGIKQANISKSTILPHIDRIIDQIDRLDIPFTNHYSNYNKGKSWSALSLRGYMEEYSFITKPAEMNDEWKKEHANCAFQLQNTELRAKINVEKLLKLLPTENFHRIRLMKLGWNGGELTRHTDQVDPDVGTTDGKLLRFHFPLLTNPNVFFTSWDAKGSEHKINMKLGECWYLDTRKPHAAINLGDQERIHLVVDVESNETLRSIIHGNKNN